MNLIYDSEVDSERWLDKETNLECYILRHGSMKHLCGYVFVPPNLIEKVSQHQDEFRVHGGVTFCGEGLLDGLFLIGFDCGHVGDLIPSMERFGHITGDIYRDINYVKEECTFLAKQIHELTNQKLIAN